MQNWLQGRAFEDWRAELHTRGFIIFPNVLSAEELQGIRGALAPLLQENAFGRNDFEGLQSNRVYAMLAKDPLFADLVLHPLALRFAEAELGESLLLSACLAICLHPGETVQPWHYDDAHIAMPRPRMSTGLSTFWALDDTTEENGATEILPGSHLWGDEQFDGTLLQASFEDKQVRDVSSDPGFRDDIVKATMPAGSLMLAQGTLWHRGGANKSDKTRTIITPQYCAGWVRQLENMLLAVPPEKAEKLPVRARELLGYSIHPPFMGYTDGMHPARMLG